MNKPEAILEIPKMPNNCVDCHRMKNGIGLDTCEAITHRHPDLGSTCRPVWCPLKYSSQGTKNRKVLLAEFDADSALEPCSDFKNYDQVIINWPDTMDRPYLVKKAISMVHAQNCYAEVILYANAFDHLPEFLNEIKGLTFCVRNKTDYEELLKLENFFEKNGYPIGIVLRLKNYSGFNHTSWHWKTEQAYSTIDNLPAANTDICRFVPSDN